MLGMDEASAQLALDLRDAVAQSLQTRRPLLHHLNADSSWLLQLPIPRGTRKDNGRHWYNILIDPWLRGGQSDVAWWLSQQFHASESKVGSVAAIEELAREIEILTGGLRLGKGRVTNEQEVSASVRTYIDAVAISHEFTDHCHKATLLEIDETVPVFATARAASLIKSWKHFQTVVNIPPFSGKSADWRTTSSAPLPDWIGVAKLTSENDLLYYHTAVMIVFKCPTLNSSNHKLPGTEANEDEHAVEAVIYTPHGIHPSDISVVTKASPRIRTLAFLHGLHDVSLSGQQLNLGAHKGLETQREIRAKYWIGTHDEVKHAGGMVKWFLNRKAVTLTEALEQESKKTTLRNGKPENLEAVLREIDFRDIGNGESLMLI